MKNTYENMPIKKEIEDAQNKLCLSEKEFTQVNPNISDEILDHIESAYFDGRFSNLQWPWEHIKQEHYSICFSYDKGFTYLDSLISVNEDVYFIVEEYSSSPIFWVYKGKINSIIKIIGECIGFEYYISPLNYQWLLCENHNSRLIGSGIEVINKMKELESQLINKGSLEKL